MKIKLTKELMDWLEQEALGRGLSVEEMITEFLEDIKETITNF